MIRRALLALTAGLLALTLVGVAPAAAADQISTTDDNRAVAVNTEDGASLFRVAFSIVRVADGTVDQTNIAAALASCTDCTTVALAFQVVLVEGDADVVAPENKAYAVNSACAECLTYASATQLVLPVDGPVRLTGQGMRRLVAVVNDIRDLERNVEGLDLATLNARVQAAKRELIAVFTEELVPIGPPAEHGGSPSSTSSTTSTSTPATTTTTTGTSTSTTTSTSTPSSTSTTTTSEPATTTTVAG